METQQVYEQAVYYNQEMHMLFCGNWNARISLPLCNWIGINEMTGKRNKGSKEEFVLSILCV